MTPLQASVTSPHLMMGLPWTESTKEKKLKKQLTNGQGWLPIGDLVKKMKNLLAVGIIKQRNELLKGIRRYEKL